MRDFSTFLDMELSQSCSILFDDIIALLIRIAVAFAVLAFFDYLYQWWDYEKNMKMSKQEIKDEIDNFKLGKITFKNATVKDLPRILDKIEEYISSNEYCKGKIHNEIMHELIYLKRMWKRPNSMYFYDKKRVGKYLCIMMN